MELVYVIIIGLLTLGLILHSLRNDGPSNKRNVSGSVNNDREVVGSLFIVPEFNPIRFSQPSTKPDIVGVWTYSQEEQKPDIREQYRMWLDNVKQVNAIYARRGAT